MHRTERCIGTLPFVQYDLSGKEWVGLETQIARTLSPEDLMLRYSCAPKGFDLALEHIRQASPGFGIFFQHPSIDGSSQRMIAASCIASSLRDTPCARLIKEPNAIEFGVIVDPRFRGNRLAQLAVTRTAEIARLQGYTKLIGFVDPINTPTKDLGGRLTYDHPTIVCGHDLRVDDYTINIPLDQKTVFSLLESVTDLRRSHPVSGVRSFPTSR